MIMNLVRYAGDYWITLADYTKTRDTEGYSDHASVKAAIRTYVVKQSQDRYIAFRGENQIKTSFRRIDITSYLILKTLKVTLELL